MSVEITIGIAALLTIFVCALVAGMLLIRRLLAREQSAQSPSNGGDHHQQNLPRQS